ncbi:hypothetical protein [Deinococcus aerius]|nr:hypothetical protein [Deinococcus aerius]
MKLQEEPSGDVPVVCVTTVDDEVTITGLEVEEGTGAGRLGGVAAGVAV